MSELTKIFMAIHNLQEVCVNRKGKEGGAKQDLLMLGAQTKSQVVSFDKYTESFVRAQEQLTHIKQYLQFFMNIKSSYQEGQAKNRAGNKSRLEDSDEEKIWIN